MIPYPVNVKKLVEMLGPRTYVNQLHAGIRESIANALDYHADVVTINFSDGQLSIFNNGQPLPPEEIHKFVTIASDHFRESDARGEFGWGHTCLIGLSSHAEAYCPKGNDVYKYLLTSAGYELAGTEKYTFDLAYGFGVRYYNIKEDAKVKDIKSYLENVFAIPLYEQELKIIFNGVELKSKLPHGTRKYVEHIDAGELCYFYYPCESGFIHYTHKGIGVQEQPMAGLIAYINENFLNLTVSKESYNTNDFRYRLFKKTVAHRLQKLIPKVPYRQKVVDFMSSLEKTIAKSLAELTDTNKSDQVPLKTRLKICPNCGSLMNVMDDAYLCPKCGRQIKKEHHKSKQFPLKRKKMLKGPKGWRSIKEGIKYPYLWMDPSTRLLILNETHPVCKDCISRMSKRYVFSAWPLRPFIERALFALELMDNEVDVLNLRKITTKSDLEYAKVLHLKIPKQPLEESNQTELSIFEG